MRTFFGRSIASGVLLLSLLASSDVVSSAEPSEETPNPKESPPHLKVFPSRYVVNYPATERYHPPVASAFQDAVTTQTVYKGRTEYFLPNGGFGLEMMGRNGVPLLHTGADLGGFRAGAPVFAIGNGVVRLSSPGVKQLNAELKLNMQFPSGPVDYGNLIIIEHRTPNDEHFLTLYAHLGDDRLVRPGDFVTAGQVIGTIGRDSGKINGGYKPHCHFAVHDGRWIEPGQRLMTVKVNGTESVVRVAELGEKETRVTITPPIPDLRLTIGSGKAVDLRREGDDYFMPSFLLWTMVGGSGARLAGYLPSVAGFRDPIPFLREVGADTSPAPVPQYTTIHPLTQTPVVDKPAPELSVLEWLQSVENPPALKDLRGKVVCLVFFQSTCDGSLSQGLPALRELADKYAHGDRVQVIGVHTVTRDFRRNAPLNARKLIQSIGLTCPVAHLGDAKHPADVAGFGVRATPWVTLIDQQGTIDFSNWMIRPAAIVERIDDLAGNVQKVDAD